MQHARVPPQLSLRQIVLVGRSIRGLHGLVRIVYRERSDLDETLLSQPAIACILNPLPREGSVMARCPFYGFRWPERSSELRYIGGNECGLDFEDKGPCLMERDGRTVNYFACPVALSLRGALVAAKDHIRFAGEA